jgi:hypothetical protein
MMATHATVKKLAMRSDVWLVLQSIAVMPMRAMGKRHATQTPVLVWPERTLALSPLQLTFASQQKLKLGMCVRKSDVCLIPIATKRRRIAVPKMNVCPA